MSLRFALLALFPLAVVACTNLSEPEGAADHHDEDGEIGAVASELSANASLASAVSAGCSTSIVMALGQQLVDEIQCLRPGTLSRIDGNPGLALGPAVFPWLQTPAANALSAAQKTRGTSLTLNSGLRTLPQQWLLYRWYQAGRCGIALAAKPGTSNHEAGIAVDVGDDSSWRKAMKSKGFSWLGSSDPVHFDYAGADAVDMRGLSVLAFQRLWNRNHPGDAIDEDGLYGPQTEARLAQAPIGGFAIGAACAAPAPQSAPASPVPGASSSEASDEPSSESSDAPSSADPSPETGGELDDAPEAVSATPSPADAHEHGDDDVASDDALTSAPAAASCSVASAGTSGASSYGLVALGTVVAGLLARRRRRASS